MTLHIKTFIVILGRSYELGDIMKKEKKINQAEHILNTAYKCLSTKGHAKISLRNIANEAGVALSQLHYYFGSKNALYSQLITKSIGNYIDDFTEKLSTNTEGINSIDQLVRFIENAVFNDEAMVRVFYDVTNLALWSEEFRGLMNKMLDEISDIIEEKIINNNTLVPPLVNENPKAIARLLVSVLLGSTIQFIFSPSSRDEISESNKLLPSLLLG